MLNPFLGSSAPDHRRARNQGRFEPIGKGLHVAARGKVGPAQMLKRATVGFMAVALATFVGVSLPVQAAEAATFVLVPGHGKTSGVTKASEDGSVTGQFTVPAVTGGGIYLGMTMRGAGPQDGYRARVHVLADRSLRVGFSRVDSGKEIVLLSQPISGTLGVGQVVRLQGEVTGTSAVTMSVRAWVDGTARPAWQKTLVDKSPGKVVRAGTTSVFAYLSSSAKNGASLDYQQGDWARLVTTPAPVVVPKPQLSANPTPTGDPGASAPQTTITSGPGGGSTQSSSSASFAFGSNKASSSFECRMDAGAWAACGSPKAYTGLAAQAHTFAVRATDPAGKADTSPATRAFTVQSAAVTPPTSNGKPSAATTGVPAGTKLTRHDGDMVITKAGTHLDKMDIHGFVTVRAPNVTISNSIVRGGVATNTTGLVTNYGSPNLLVEDTDLVAEHPSVWIDGLKGWEFTARRIHVVGNVDSVKIHGDNATVEDSLLENTQYFASDPNQGGGPTHNDNIQISRGKNITIKGNTIRGSQNFAILGSATQADTPNLVVSGNWLDGGHCTVKLSTLRGYSVEATVTNNKFGPNRKVQSCVFQAEPQVKLTENGNVYESTGKPVPIIRFVS